MKQAGQIVLFRFPQTDLSRGKLRPALLLKELPGRHDDWLVCMISSQLHQATGELDETIHEQDADFSGSGLKIASVVRAGRLAVVEGPMLVGSIGAIAPERLLGIRRKLADWLAAG